MEPIIEATIPSNLRWLPRGMDVNYLKKCTGALTATAEVDPDTFFKLAKYPGDVAMPVVVKNEADEVVTTATV
jgi:hypothetical protein